MNEARETLLKWLNNGGFKTYKELANFLGVAQNTLDVWKQRGKIPEKHILKYTQMINEHSSQSLHVKNYNIPLLSATVSAGSGIENFEIEIEGSIPVPSVYFKTYPNIKKFKALKVVGDSMSPTLNDSDIIIIEECVTFSNDGIYVINMGGELRVKRLIRRIEGIEIKSDNPTYGSEFVKEYGLKGFFIIGKVKLEIKRC